MVKFDVLSFGLLCLKQSAVGRFLLILLRQCHDFWIHRVALITLDLDRSPKILSGGPDIHLVELEIVFSCAPSMAHLTLEAR